MAKKFFLTLMLLAAVGLVTGTSFADQITLANSTSGQIQFAGQNPTTVDFLGTVSGFGLFEGIIGTYQIWQTGFGSLTLGNQMADTFDVTMGSAILNFSMVLNDVNHSTITGTFDLRTLIGGATRAPEFIGTFTTASETFAFLNSGYQVGGVNDFDLTVNLHGSNGTVNQVYAGLLPSVSGPVSSGEIPGVPEPSTLGLLGSGVLTMAGLLKRRLR